MLLKKLGKYEIIDWLGGGRFGDVFLACDTMLDKNFALIQILSDFIISIL
jgi:hypothetical protein